MLQEAGTFLPNGVSQERVQGTVDNFRRESTIFSVREQIRAVNISPSNLGKFIANQGLSFYEGRCYSDIFSNLRQLSETEQEALLTGFYKECVRDFPNPEKFAEELVRINNIDYFKPKEEPSPDRLQELVNQHLNSLNLVGVPIGIIRNDWNVAGDVMRESKRDKRQNTGLGANEKTPDGKAWDELWYTAREKIGDVPTIWDAPWNAMIEVTQDRAGDAMRESMDDDSMTMPWNVERDAAGNAAWTIVEDEMSEWGYTKGNPFSPLISIYELGYLPIGLAINGKGLKEFNIFIPPIKKAAINMHN